MTKEEALEEFLKGLKVVFSNASAYNQDHPYFVKSIEAFKFKIDELEMFINPLRINFSPESLFFDGAYLKKTPLHDEIAAVFHARKIKGLELKEGVTVEELSYFLSKACLNAREIIKAGGLQMLLDTEKAPHIRVEELDYSLLLRDQGEESKDIWLCLFQGIMGRGDHQKIIEIADHFEGLMSNLKAEDIIDEPQLKKDIHSFLLYLKSHNNDKFRACAKSFFKLMLKDRHILQQHTIEEIMDYFKGLDVEFFAQVLWEEIIHNEDFDAASLDLFNQLINNTTHRQITPLIIEKLKSSPIATQNQKIVKRIKELFTLAKESHIAAPYREVLTFLSQESAFTQGFILEGESLYTNYHLILLNLLVGERDPERLASIIEKILGAFGRIIADKKFEYFGYLFEVVKQRKSENTAVAALFEPLDKRIAQFIETMAFEEEIPLDFEFFIDALQTSSMDVRAYFDKIFIERRINPYSLKLLLKLFPDQLPYFYAELEKKYSDLDFLERIVESLQWVHLPLTFEVLKHMFFFANNLIKIEIVRAMRRVERSDQEFFFAVLNSEDFSLKKEALLVLMQDKDTRKEAIRRLFSVRNPWGKKNNLIYANLAMIEEVDLKDAKEYVLAISAQWLFWHRRIRKKAKEILQRWNSGKD